MLDACACFDRMQNVDHPLARLLKERSKMEKSVDKLGENVRVFLKRIPVLEDQKIFQLINELRETHNLSKAAAKLDCNFGFDVDFLEFVEAHSSPDNPETKLMIFPYFLGIGYGCCVSVDRSSLVRVLKVLKCVPCDIRKEMFSFALAVVLEKASNSGMLQGDKGIYGGVCELIAGSPHLSQHIFSVVARVFKIIGSEGSEEMHALLQNRIEEKVLTNNNCLHGNDVGMLVDCLASSLCELDAGSLMTLARAADKCMLRNCERYLRMINLQVKACADDVYFKNPLDLSHGHEEEVFGTPSAVPDISFEFQDGIELQAPIYDAVRSELDLRSFFGTDLYKKMMNYVEFGAIWPASLREIFLSLYQQDLMNPPGNILFYVAMLSLIAHRANDPTMTQAVVSIVLCTPVFSETMTVFWRDTMDDRVNFVRNLIIELIADTSPPCISQVVNMCVIYPVLLTENLMRVLLRFQKYDPAIFVQEPLRTILAQTLLNLTNLKSDISVTVRSCFLDFIFSLIVQPAAAANVLASDSLLPVYFGLIFERSVRDSALLQLKHCIANANTARSEETMAQTVHLVAQTLNVCRQRRDDPEYMSLLMKIAEVFVHGIEYNPKLSLSSLEVLDEILICVIEWHDEVLLTHALSFIYSLYFAKSLFTFSKERFSQLYRAVTSTFPDDLPSYVLTKLYCTLGCISFLESKTSILIRNHMALPWIFAICSYYSTFPEVLKSWIGLCKFSFNNRIALHKGLVDSLLLEFLGGGPVTYKCIPIEVKDSIEVRDYACKLIPRIVAEETNFEVAYRVCNLLKLQQYDSYVSKLFTRLVAAGASPEARFPDVPLDSCFPIVEIRTIPWNTIKNQFTFDIVAKYDDIASLRIDSKITIMKLTDDVTTLEFYLHNTMVSVMFQPPGKKPIFSHLFRNVIAAEWMRMTTVIMKASRKPPQYHIFSLFNGDRLCETVVNDDFLFNENFRIIIGGSDQSPENHLTFFKFRDFRIYPFVPNDEDLLEVENRNEQLMQRAIYSSVDKKEGTMLPFYHESHGLLRYMCDGNLSNRIVELSSPAMLPTAIDFLSYMFRTEYRVQTEFTGVEVLLEKMMKSRQHLQYDHYYSLYRTLGGITYPELQAEWFEKLVMNVWIWAHCEQQQFQKIICHWKNNLISRYADLFKRKSYFSRLLTQFNIMFCIETETDTGFFRDSLTNKFSKSCADAFMNFILSVTKLNFNAQDFDLLFSFATSAKHEYQIYFVKFLLIVSKNRAIKERMTSEHFSLLHRLLQYSDRDLVCLVIIALHDLSIDNVFEHMVAIAYEVLSYDCIDKIFMNLLKSVRLHPGIIAFLTMIGLHLGRKYIRQLSLTMAKIETPRYSEFVQQDNWHIFFILIAYNIAPGDLPKFCGTFAQCLFLCQDPTVFVKTMSILVRLSALRPSHHPILHLLEQMNVLIRDECKEYVAAIVKFSYFLLFLHLDGMIHSQAILSEFARSPYSEQCQHIPEPFDDSEVLGVAALETFMDDGLFNFTVRCQMYLTEDGQLRDGYLQRITLARLGQVHDKSIDAAAIEQQISFFTNRKGMSVTERFSFSQHLENSFEKRKKEFSDLVVQNLQHFKTGFLGLVLSARNIVTLCDKASEERKLGHLMLVNVANEMQRLKPFDQLGQEKVLPLRRKNFVGVAFVPTRRKRLSKRTLEIPAPSSPGSEIPCTLLGVNKKRRYTVQLGTRRIIFTPTTAHGKAKHIFCNTVKMLFARPAIDAFEFFLTTEQQYLVQFEPKEFQSVLQKLQSMKFWPAEVIQLSGEALHIPDLTKKWCEKEISTFEYIMHLNLASGFSFRDGACYPVAPPVLTDINNPQSLRTTYRGVTITEPENSVRPDALAATFTQRGTVPADLYFDPLCIPENTALPQWANSRYEFVYRSRKILESPGISLVVSQWIDRVFGWRCRNSAHKIFAKEHPQRNVVDEIQFKDYELNLAVDVRHVARTSIEKTKVVLGVVQQSNLIHRITISYRSGPQSAIEEIGAFNSECDDLYFGQTNHQVIAYSQSHSTLFVVSDAGEIKEIPFFAKSPIFASLGVTLVFATDKCTLAECVFLPDGKCNVRQICFATSEITDLAANKALQIAAFSTLDGVVHIYDVRSGECLGEHNTNKEITQVLVTQHWGFVVAICPDELFVYSQNGEFLKSQALSEPIGKAFSFTLFSGFDFLAYQNRKMEIVVFEAFHPENQLVASTCPCDAVRIMYDQYRSNFIVVSKKGLVKMIPSHLANYVF